ncbi:hypothetical protein IKX73_00120 [Candidatus Saccharibacteria bacterium]|nr:hypothetical protein [Candidatus Saccharibacteria bacterium]
MVVKFEANDRGSSSDDNAVRWQRLGDEVGFGGQKSSYDPRPPRLSTTESRLTARGPLVPKLERPEFPVVKKESSPKQSREEIEKNLAFIESMLNSKAKQSSDKSPEKDLYEIIDDYVSSDAFLDDYSRARQSEIQELTKDMRKINEYEQRLREETAQLEQQMRGETMNPSDGESSKNTKGKLASKITRMGGIFGRRH